MELRAVGYLRRDALLAALTDAAQHHGYWLMDQQAISPVRTDFQLELLLRSADEFYADLMRLGLEISRVGHHQLAALCTLGRHGEPATGLIIDLHLQVFFREERDREFRARPDWFA
jgi:hypothetical protein